LITLFNHAITSCNNINEVVNVLRITQEQMITVITHKGMSLTYSTEELSDTGLRAAGVKSINLKDEAVEYVNDMPLCVITVIICS
jgi:topoisomerase-4 subunit A